MEHAGKVYHSQIKIGDCHLAVADENETSAKSPETLGGTSLDLLMNVANCDEIYE